MLFLGIIFSGPIYFLVTGEFMGKHWSEAASGSTGIAPLPSQTPEAVAQVYAARTWGRRGAVAVHTWISVKPANADSYTVYQKIGWRLRYDNAAVVIREDVPDRIWYGNQPWLIGEIRGENVDEVIGKIHKAAVSYPFAKEYRIWPGPNSNTFVAWITRRVPELRADLPPMAIGKDYLGSDTVMAKSPSGSGYQISLWGVLGITVGIEEGIEFNIAGVHFGIDFFGLALRLPGFGIVSPFGK